MTVKELSLKTGLTSPAIYQRVRRAAAKGDIPGVYADDENNLTQEAIDLILKDEEIEQTEQTADQLKAIIDFKTKEFDRVNHELITLRKEKEHIEAVSLMRMHMIDELNDRITHLEADKNELYGLLSQEQQVHRLLLEAPKKGIVERLRGFLLGDGKKEVTTN